MSKFSLMLVIALVLTLSAPLGAAPSPADQAEDTNLDVLLSTIRANRKALVAINLQLTDDEAADFWPVYDRYQKELNAVGDRLVALIRDYTDNFTTLSNEKALKIVRDYLKVQADRVEVRTSYLGKFTEILPGRTVARLYQIENKMDAVIRYDLAATIPVLDERGGDSE